MCEHSKSINIGERGVEPSIVKVRRPHSHIHMSTNFRRATFPAFQEALSNFLSRYQRQLLLISYKEQVCDLIWKVMVMNVESSLVIIDLIDVICKYGRLFLHAVLNCVKALCSRFIAFIYHYYIYTPFNYYIYSPFKFKPFMQKSLKKQEAL